MPAKTITYEVVEMDDTNKKFYEAIRKGVKEEADKIDLKSSNLLALTTRLRQATSAPTVLTSQPIESTKIIRAVELVEDLVEQGEKVIIMCSFKESVYQLAAKLEQFHPLVCTGDQKEGEIARAVADFQDTDNNKVMICTAQKMGTGFTLNAANYMICVDQPWTDAAFSQTTDRIWRITNEKPAFITVLVTAGTIDERVQYIVEHKKELADFIVDGKENSISDDLKKEMFNIIKEL